MSDRLLKESDVIEVVTQYISCDYPTEEMAREDAEVLIGRTPSADRPQEWIPCSERLPKIGQKVLASTKKTVFTQVFKGYYSEPKRWAWENNRVKEIEAWQPLPKPWKGADDE